MRKRDIRCKARLLDHEKVLKETLEVAHRNLSLSRMSLEYLDSLRADTLLRIENICKVIDSIEETLGLKKQPS